MLTCKIGNKKFNVFDKSKEEFKKLSHKGVLKCPVTDLRLTYKHGKIKIPHFAYTQKPDQDVGFWENETKEHYLGKIYLYKWLRKFKYIKNLELEKWIPETRQIADIYFEIFGKKYVIEYQCSNLTIERFEERRFLYSTLDIKDIWIFGKENFNMYQRDLYGNLKLKAIEYNFYKNEGHIYHFNPFRKELTKSIKDSYPTIYKTDIRNRNNFYIDRGEIMLPDEIDWAFKKKLNYIVDFKFDDDKILLYKSWLRSFVSIDENEFIVDISNKINELNDWDYEELLIERFKLKLSDCTFYICSDYNVIKQYCNENNIKWHTIRNYIYIEELYDFIKSNDKSNLCILVNPISKNILYLLEYAKEIFKITDNGKTERLIDT